MLKKLVKKVVRLFESNEKALLRSYVKALKLELVETKESVDLLVDDLEKGNVYIELLEATEQDLQEQVAMLEYDVDELQHEVHELEAEVDDLSFEIDSLHGVIASMEQELDELQ